MLKLSIHGSCKGMVEADKSGDTVWIRGKEGDHEAVIFLDKDQSVQIVNVLVEFLGLKFECVEVKDKGGDQGHG